MLLSACALFASACSDATLATGAGAPRLDGHARDERPVFGSADEFLKDVEHRLTLETEELVAVEAGQPYQSLRAYLDPNEWTEKTAAAGDGSEEATGNEGIALEADGVVREDFPLSDAVLSILNRRGEIQIGDTIYRLTRDNVYAVLPENLELLDRLVPTLSSPAPADADERISVHPIESTERTVDGEGSAEGPARSRIAAPSGPAFHYTISATYSCTWQNGDRRMKGKGYITNALFYSEAGVKTDWERKKWFGWSNTWQSGTLWVSYSTNNLKKGSTWVSPSSGSSSKTGAASVRLVVTSGGFVTIRGDIDAWHGSSIGWCDTHVSRP